MSSGENECVTTAHFQSLPFYRAVFCGILVQAVQREDEAAIFPSAFFRGTTGLNDLENKTSQYLLLSRSKRAQDCIVCGESRQKLCDNRR